MAFINQYIFEKEKIIEDNYTKVIIKPNSRPIGCVVAISKDKIGYCAIHPLDRNKCITKKAMLKTAIARAEKGVNDEYKIPSYMVEMYEHMKDRARKYFKD